MSLLGTLTGSDEVGTAIGAASGLVKDAIDKIWPNPTEETAAKVALLKAQTQAVIDQLDATNRAANAEAASRDPWTSRARPSFLYVMYILILFSIPMGGIAAVSPDTAKAVGEGMKAWLSAVPTQLWDVFGLCFTVYAGSRTVEKLKGVAK